MRRTGAQIVWEMLEHEGVDVVFGIPGGAIMHTYHPRQDYNVHHILMRHEQCAAHAADGYARVSGKVGVAMATSGPGATNLVTGVADANMDRAPVVAISGQATTARMHKETHKHLDLVDLFRPVSKYRTQVIQPQTVPEVVRKAFKQAEAGKPTVLVFLAS